MKSGSQKNREKGTQFDSNIENIRKVEDCIRATKKYTEGIWSKLTKHPIQGAEIPSRTFHKYYEVYPDNEISWDMPAGEALDWLWGEYKRIDVRFRYDYRDNKASIIIINGAGAVEKLAKAIPGFGEALNCIGGNNGRG